MCKEKYIEEEKNRLYQYIVKCPLTVEDAERVLKFYGELAAKGINIHRTLPKE